MKKLVWGLSLVLFSSWAAADVSVVVQSKTIASDPVNPTIDLVDVYVDVTGTNPDISFWQSAVDLVSLDTGLSFGTPTPTDASAPARPMLIGTNFDTPNGVDTNTAIRASATAGTNSGATPFVDEAGLFRIPITIAPGTIGTFSINLDLDENSGTLLIDEGLNPIEYTSVNGVITVVPEPAGLMVLAALGSGLLIRRRTA